MENGDEKGMGGGVGRRGGENEDEKGGEGEERMRTKRWRREERMRTRRGGE